MSSTNSFSSSLWINEFLSQPSSKYFVEVDTVSFERISAQFLERIPQGEAAKNKILNKASSQTSSLPSFGSIDSSADLLYGLVHKEFIRTPQGLFLMKEKFFRKEFGTCSRVYCRFAPLLPIGLNDQLGQENVKLFCCNCLDIYRTPPAFEIVDGVFFGSNFTSIFYKQFEKDISQIINFIKDESSSDSFMTSDVSSMSLHSIHEKFDNQSMYVPKIFGFRVHESADHGPKNAWLRIKPNVNCRTGCLK